MRDTSARYRAELLAAVGRGCGDRAARCSHEADRSCDLMARRINILTANDIATAAQGARARGDGEARHLVRELRRLFNFACSAGHLAASPVDEWFRREKGGRCSIPWMRDGTRERVLSDDELKRVWAAAESLDPTARAFARLTLLRACRFSEMTGLSWSEIQTEVSGGGTKHFAALLLPPGRTKNRRSHRVPLSALAAAELAAHDPSGDTSAHVTGLVFAGVASRTAAICRALRKAAAVDDWSWHDFRQTAATTMARLGCPREHVEAALNHISARGAWSASISATHSKRKPNRRCCAGRRTFHRW